MIKRYHIPATPYARALAHPKIGKAVKARLLELYGTLDPVALLAEMRAAQAELGTRVDARAGKVAAAPLRAPSPTPDTVTFAKELGNDVLRTHLGMPRLILAQADFGEARAKIGGTLRKVHVLAMHLPHSDAIFVVAYPAETTEAFCDGHVKAFAFFGGVPQSILYDNTKIAVARILGDGRRQRTRVFSKLQSHDLFTDRFGRPGKGNDKGKVEGLVGYARRNFLVPVPVFESFDALNAHLLECCQKRQGDRLRGHAGTIGERLARDLAVFQNPLSAPYDACNKRPGRVRSLSLVRYRNNDYSVPTPFGHRQVLIRGDVHEVVISCGTEVIARHIRSYEREDFIFNPLHYLALLEQKTNALDQAAPLNGWELPDAFATLRRLLEARMGKKGKREFVQVLRLLEIFTLDDVAGAVHDAIARGAAGFDAVKTTSARSYMDLLVGQQAEVTA